MKKLFFSIFIFITTGIFAQDLIILKDRNIIEAKVTEISQTEIRYKRFNHLDGSVIVVPAANVLSIRYENGTTEIINSGAQPLALNFPAQSAAQALPERNPNLNSLGVSMGYPGISNFGLSVIWNGFTRSIYIL